MPGIAFPDVTFAEVLIVSVPVDPPVAYTYRIPDDWTNEILPGTAVEGPFGASPKAMGIVVRCPAPDPGRPVKTVRRIALEGHLDQRHRELLAWISDHYLCPLARVYQAALPPTASRARTRRVLVPGPGADSPSTARQGEIVSVLRAHGGRLSVPELTRLAATTSGTIKLMVERQILAVEDERVWRRPDLPDAAQIPRPALLEEQLVAVQAIQAGTRGEVFLLQGVTGSGKTEVYLHAIEETVSRGQQALVLVPEIALTPQTVARFRDRFQETIAVLHSALGEGERHDEWERLRTGTARVGIGARSAILAPFADLGLIVVDEEHEGSYKQDTVPRYHARTVALARSRIEGCQIVLGSATPSQESHLAVTRGQATLLRLNQRVHGRPLPPVTVVDMRQELADGNRSPFSRLLAESIERQRVTGEQTILLINRRGYATFVMCRRCGTPVQCPNCSVSLTYHRVGEALRCHHCDHHEPPATRCPSCESTVIRHFGAGTQQIAEAVQERWPDLRVLRLDRDTTSRKGAHAQILGAFARGEADLLVGTQMIAKGLDLPRVTLVGVVAADASLNVPDFRSAERTFQLLTQVAGRAGRGDRPGRVIVQAYAPEHPAIDLARRHDVATFLELEQRDREELTYPPYHSMVALVASAPEHAPALEAARALASALTGVPGVRVLGPADAILKELRGRHRVQVLIKAEDLAPLRPLIRKAIAGLPRVPDLRISVDVDPVTLL